jgi:hypothetical protein
VPSNPDSPLARLLCRSYDVLLLAYPSEFRRQYGNEIRVAFRDQVRDAIQDGAWALVPFLLRTSVDWLHSVVRERYAAMNERDRQAQAERIASLKTMKPPSSLWTVVVVLPVALILAGFGVMRVQDLIFWSSRWSANWDADTVTLLRAGIVVVGATFASIVLLILWLVRPSHWEILKNWRWTRGLMVTLTAGVMFSFYLPLIGQREKRVFEYLWLPLMALFPQTMKAVGVVAFGGVIVTALGLYNHQWTMITVGMTVALYGFVKPLPEPRRATSVFGQRLAYGVLIAVLIGAWLVAGYSGVYITHSLARVVRHGS